MRTILTLLALIGLIGCRVTNNYYSIYPTKVIETKMPTLEGDVIYPSWTDDPGFYKPIKSPYTLWIDTSYSAEMFDLTDTTWLIRFDDNIIDTIK